MNPSAPIQNREIDRLPPYRAMVNPVVARAAGGRPMTRLRIEPRALLAIVGLGGLLLAQGLAWGRVGHAALPPGARRPTASQPHVARETVTVQVGDPEFAGQARNEIPATPFAQILQAARDHSGREDPFIALGFDAHDIVPLPPPALPVHVTRTLPRPTFHQVNAAATVAPPSWEVRALFNTGREQVALLESGDEEREVRVGDMLDDGSQVVAISSQGVVLVKQGVRFLKQIGGAEDGQNN